MLQHPFGFLATHSQFCVTVSVKKICRVQAPNPLRMLAPVLMSVNGSLEKCMRTRFIAANAAALFSFFSVISPANADYKIVDRIKVPDG